LEGRGDAKALDRELQNGGATPPFDGEGGRGIAGVRPPGKAHTAFLFPLVAITLPSRRRRP
jgi:hypothetical protein